MNDPVEKRQWYIVGGLVPINEVDTHDMAGGVEDYDIITEVTFEDVLINIVIGWLTIQTRSVIVVK